MSVGSNSSSLVGLVKNDSRVNQEFIIRRVNFYADKANSRSVHDKPSVKNLFLPDSIIPKQGCCLKCQNGVRFF